LKKIKYKEIKELLKKNSLKIISNISDDDIFLSVKTILNASNKDLSFFSNLRYLNDLKNTKAKACLVENKYKEYLPKNCEPIIVEDPYLALALISNLQNNEIFKSNGIVSDNSIINSSSNLHNNVQINPFSVIHEETEIFENVLIGSNSNIGPNVIINKNVVIHDNVTISNSIIMENSVIKSGARIGGTGFGFDMKTKQKINHTGNVIIGKNSSIGSNTTIDRAVFDSTIIGEFSNIDNLVQIAHNVVIGDFAIIAAQVGVAGSTNIGDNIKIGGQAGIAGHLVIGDNVTIAAKSGVTKNIPSNNVVAGFPAKDINLWKKEVIRNNLRK
tara:strand:+ start:2488 stop:3474 length:987 start_codon:yes stop_codon:yes gene_type:complete